MIGSVNRRLFADAIVYTLPHLISYISYELPTNGYHNKVYDTCSHQGEYQCNMWNIPGEEIYQTREGVFDLLLQTLRSRLKKTKA